ncbi:MAG TPA: YwpF family protein [Virgibacillus sp.]|nr:YwpF family protein [Virgibacillus sp.]
MKTFKLKALEVIEEVDEEMIRKKIPLLDGLIINREDDQNQWVIEAYIDNNYLDYFTTLKEEHDEIIIQVKITKESNSPAIFMTSIIGVNEIGSRMNVLFKGKIIDRHKDEIEEMLGSLITEGYEGEELLMEFKSIMEKG